VHRLLGGALRRKIAVTHSIGLIGFEEAEREAAQRCARAFAPSRSKSVSSRIAMWKWCAGCGTRSVLEQRSVSTPIRATARSASGAHVRRMERSDLIYSSNRGRHRAVWPKSPRDRRPVMADESAWNAHDVIQIAEKRAAQIVSIYTTKPADSIAPWRSRRGAGAGIICNVNGSVETGVGNLANLQLAAAAAPWCCRASSVSTPAQAQSPGNIAGIYYTDDLIAEPMRLVDGAIDLPSGPGMGIPVDEAKIRQ